MRTHTSGGARQKSNNNMMWVSVKLLSNICNPLRNPPWGKFGEIFFEDIARATSKKLLEPRSYNPLKGEFKQHHIDRIAWYVVNGWGDSHITIDFFDDWIIFDGNHRLAAAIFRGDDMIWADVYGSKENIATLYRDEHLTRPAG